MQFQHYRWHMPWCRHFWDCSQQHTWNYTKKSQIAPRKDITEIANESVYGTHLRMLLRILENRLKGAKGCKIWSIKNWEYKWECKRKNDECIWSAPDDVIQGAPDNTPGAAPKGELQYLYTQRCTRRCTWCCTQRYTSRCTCVVLVHAIVNA